MITDCGKFELKPIDKSDVHAIHHIWTEETVRRYLWDDEIIPLAQTEEIVNENKNLFSKSGYGIWGIREATTDKLIGFAGFWHFREPPELELLFGVKAGYWNKGIATEASRCVIEYAFETLNMSKIVASTDAANTASIKVLEKLAMTFTKREVVDGLDTVFYELKTE